MNEFNSFEIKDTMETRTETSQEKQAQEFDVDRLLNTSIKKSSHAYKVMCAKKSFFFTAIVIACILFCYSFLFYRVQSDYTIIVKKGDTISDVSEELYKKNIIASSGILKLLFLLNESTLYEGTYLIKNKSTVFDIASALKEQGLNDIKITIPEGYSNEEIAHILKSKLPMFDDGEFIRKAQMYEGQLFPDTYFVKSTVSPEEVITMMKGTFAKKAKINFPAYSNNKNELVVMASILEREAHTTQDRQKIADVLWRRHKNKERLQVDASFAYLLNKGTRQITISDLQLDSEYNTYKIRGLPKKPLGNPGNDSLFAAAHPIKSTFNFYLADRSGVTHFSKTSKDPLLLKAKYVD